MTTTATTVGGKYTEEILNKNFTAVAKEFERIEAWRKHMGGHISELYELAEETARTVQLAAQAAPKPKGIPTKYKVILGVAVGIYIGKKVMTREFNEKLERVKHEAKEQFDNFVAEQKDNKSVPVG